jgi:serine/threonine protein kinase
MTSPPVVAKSAQKAGEATRIDPPLVINPGKSARAPDGAKPKKESELQKFSRKMPKKIGAYDILAEINRGGMGIVYKAYDPNLRRNVAIKVLLAGEGASEEDIKRFQREAQATARLQHSNIVPIYAVGTHEGKPYFVMDFIEGKTAKQLKDEGLMAPRLALSIIEGVAEALHHAHLNGVVHRDIKPGNIIVDKFGRAQLMDFGLARRIDEDLDITQAGTTMGTPSYMSPEQAEGKLSEVDGQSDVYSAGACLYEFLTGRPPFDGATVMSVLRQVVDETPVPCRQINPKIHRDVETICMKCLEHDKINRYGNAKFFADDIRRFNAGEAILARPLPLLPSLLRKAKRHKEVTIASLVVMLTIFVASAYAIHRSRVARQQQIQERLSLLNGYLSNAKTLQVQAQETVASLEHVAQGKFEETAAKAKELIVEAMTFYRQAENLAPDDTAARTGLELLRKLDNDLEVTSFIAQAAAFLDPPLREDGQRDAPNYGAAEYAARLALKRDPENAVARKKLRDAVGVRAVTLEVVGPQCDVFARRIFDGNRRIVKNEPERPLGKTPVRGQEFEPGLHILNFQRPGSLQQATVWVSRDAKDEDLTVKITINAYEENMVIIPEGMARPPQRDYVKVRAFAVDRFEYPNKAGVEPLTGIAPMEARGYCEKLGKKVLTSAQWVRACSGDSERPYPYGKVYASGVCATGYDIDAQERPFVSGFFSRCRTPEGIYDMSGNVAEWTEGDQQDTDFGGDWTSEAKYALSTVSCRASSSSQAQTEDGRKEYRRRLGFRCGKEIKGK